LGELKDHRIKDPPDKNYAQSVIKSVVNYTGNLHRETVREPGDGKPSFWVTMGLLIKEQRTGSARVFWNRGALYERLFPDSWPSERKLCGNDVIVGSMEKSSDFPTLSTMTWMPLRGIHIPTKLATIFFIRPSRSNPGHLTKERNEGINDAKQKVLNSTSTLPSN